MTDFDLTPPIEARAEQLASIGQRIGGALIDGLLTSMVVIVPLLLGIMTLDDLQGSLPGPTVVGLFSFGAIYTVVPTALWGQTLGKIAVGTRVVTAEGGSLPGWRRAVVRWSVPGILGRLPLVGLWVSLAVTASLVIDPRRRGLHDRLAGTIVVRVPRPKPAE